MRCSPSVALLVLALLAVQSHFAEANKECYGSVGGANGHIYQFDGGHVTTFCGGCQFLLASSKHGSCKFKLYASFEHLKLGHGHHRGGLSRLRTVTLKIGSKTFKMVSGRHLLVKGKPRSVPYSESGVRVFYSGEDLVLVLKKCDVWITFDGAWTATFRLGARYRKKVTGLAGNCDGRPENDNFGSLEKAFKIWKRKGWISGCRRHPKKQKCHGRHEAQKARKACRKVIRGRGHCSNTDVLKPCIIDYCSTRYRPDIRKKVLCANFYLHSRRCARHHYALAWRHRSGCPLKCGRHQHFSKKANPCPKTCENHFFGTKQHCFKLPSAEGCRCNKNFVLDGSRCVRPKKCHCLGNLCIDRADSSKCRRWKAHGRCHRYPELMSKFCRLTCGMCVPRCRNQISTPLCQKLKRLGKCHKGFYRMMCRATCQPRKCGCPPKRRVVSKCHRKYQNKAITTLRWFADSLGRCRKSILTRFRACGSCPFRLRTKWRKCNYCKGVQFGKRVLQFREKYFRRRCIRRVQSVRRRCRCPPIGGRKRVSFIKCVRNHLKVRVTKTYRATRHCTRCERVTQQKVIRNIKCSGHFITGKCHHKSHFIRKEFKRYARDCHCLTSLVRSRKIMCRCQKPLSRTLCKEDHFLTKTTSWSLKKGRCIRSHHNKKRPVLCHRHHRTWKTCQRKGCEAFSHTSFFHVRGCKCRKQETKRHLGKCCCPPGSRRVERVDRFWNKIIIITHQLIDHRCHKKVIVHKIRIACPKGHQHERCDGRRGVKVFVKEWLVKQGNHCIRKQEARETKIKCRRDVIRKEGRCHLLEGNIIYRLVELHFSKRRHGSCDCVRRMRTVREMCGCREGKYSRLTKCPKGCNGPKKCRNDCVFYKEFFYFKRHAHQCREHVFKRLDFRCCCREDKKVKVWCKDEHTSMQEVSFSVLKSHKCHRVRNTTSKRIHCKRVSETKIEPHKRKHFYFVAKFEWFVSDCKCRVRVTRKECRSFCYKPTKSQFCDIVRRQWVTRHITWKLHDCRHCVRKLEDRRVPVRCSHSVRRWKHCDKRTGVLTNHKEWFEQSGCHCIKRQSSTRLRCRCPKPVAGRRHCNAQRNAFEKKVTFWVLTDGRCHKKIRIERDTVRCSRDVQQYSKCNHKKGVKVVYTGERRPKKCQCVRKWSIRNSRYRCNCKRENRRVKRVRRHLCDRHRNRKVILRFFFVLRHGRCIKRTRRSYRRFRCPRPSSERHKCDEERRRQLEIKHFFVKKNCRCVRRVRRRYSRCGCRGKRLVRKRFCKKRRGVIVHVVIKRKWNDEEEYCETNIQTRSHRVYCRVRTRFIISKCIKNKYYVERKVFFVRRGCKCLRKERRHKRNCHCKNVLRRHKCPHNGFMRREVTEIRRWDMKTHRCRTKRFVTRKIRCRCPKGFKRTHCKAGEWIKETVKFVLRDSRCFEKIDQRKHRVHCGRVVRHRFTACSKCHRFVYTLEKRLDPARCACFFAVVRKQRCPCCCPKNTSHRKCKHDAQWEHVFKHHAAQTGLQCGCRSWVDRKHEKVHCSTKKHFKWLKCNRRSCFSHQQVSFHQAKHCQCKVAHKLTGKRRVCCCLTRPRTSRLCRNSAIFERRVFHELKHWRCIQRTTERRLHHWTCKRKPVIKIGRCNRRTCRRSVHTLVDEVSRPHCHCHQVIRDRHTRPCCCLKQPKQETRCHHNCWVHRTTRSSFDNRRLVCIGIDTVKRWCVGCPAPTVHIEKCNRKTCKQRISQETHELNRCKCKRRVDYKFRVCCCPAPTVSGPKCRHQREKVWLHTSWRLSNGKCMKEVKETHQRVVCRRGVTQVLKCNRSTCRKRIRHETLQVRRCKCHSTWHETHRTCCCRPAVRVKTRCERDRFLVQFKTTRTLNSHFNCVSRTTKHLVSKVHNCHTYERRGPCDKKTRHAAVHIFHQKPKKCRCDVYRKSVRHVLCRCPGPREKTSKCDKKSCHLEVVKEWFTSNGSGDHFKCIKHHRKTRLRCCCHRRPTRRNFCDHRSGFIRKEETWHVFQAHSRACIKRHSTSIVKKLVCPKSFCHTGKCNRHTGFKLHTCHHFSKERSHCKCNKKVSKHKIICSCPKGHIRRFCKGNALHVTVQTSWRLSRHQNRCIRRVKQITRHLNCSSRRQTVRKCRGCRGLQSTYYLVLRRCRCLRMKRSRRVLCCCPKSRRARRCLGNEWLIESVNFKLRNNRCIKNVRRELLVVPCKRKRSINHECKGCTRRKETLHFRIHRCKCQVSRRTVVKKLCCCPKPRAFIKCRHGVIKKVRETWHMSLGRCLKNLRTTERRVRCKHSHEKAFHCNRDTGRQKIVTTKFIRRGCRCVKRQRVRYDRCHCQSSHNQAEKCGRKTHRRVFRISYFLVQDDDDEVCQPKRRFLYSEPCRCPKTRQARKCASNGGEVIITRKSWDLVKEHGIRECVLQVRVIRRPVECDGISIVWSNCRHFRKTRSVIVPKPVRCKCRRHVSRQPYACHCHKKSFKRRFCDRNRSEHVTISKKFFSRRYAASCSSITRWTHTPLRCSRKKRRTLLSRKCGLSRHHGWYSKYLITWKVPRGCRCVIRRKTELKLCRCERDRESTKCSLSGQFKVTTEYNFEQVGSRCHLSRVVTRKPVLCEDSRPQLRFQGCDNCRREVSVSQCYIRACRRRHYEQSGLQLCCAPPPIKRHYCDKHSGRWVTEITTFKLKKSGPLIKDYNGSVLVAQMKVVSSKRKSFVKVRCPKSQLKEHCNRHSGSWKKTSTTWHRVGCECKKKIQRWSGKCQCPAKQVRWSSCKNHYKVETVIHFDLKHHKCVRRERRQTYLCACRESHSFTRCDGHGHWRTCNVSFKLQFKKQRCQEQKHCHNRPHTCPVHTETRERCIRFKRIIKRSEWTLDRRRCKCVKKVLTRQADCNCHKRHSHHTVCKHGALITTFKNYIQKAERCLRKIRSVAKPVYCNTRHRSRVIHGSCVKNPGKHRGHQKLLTEWEENHNCKCVRKFTISWVPCLCHLIKKFRTRKSVKCVRGTVLLHTTIFFKLTHGHCVRQVDRREKKIHCVGTKEVPEKCRRNRNGDTFSVTRLFHKVSNGRCGCEWKQRALRYRICKCRKSHHLKNCLRDRVWHSEHISFVRVPGAHTCHRHVKRNDKKVYCPRPFAKKTKCHRCGFIVRHYVYKHSHCKCVAKLQRVEKLRCCCAKPITKHSCDASRHLKVAVTLTFTLRNHACHRGKSVKTQRVRCGRKIPQYRESACVKGFRKITKTVHFAFGCSCRAKTTKYKQRCACSRVRLYQRGKCGRWFAQDRWLAFKLKSTGKKIPGTNKPLMRCVRYVADRQKRRCRCPKGYQKHLCKNENIKVHIKITFRLRGNSCQRIHFEREQHLPCSRRRRLIRIEHLPRKCSRHNGFIQVHRHIFVQAKRCRCIRSKRQWKRICDCLQKYGRKRRVQCIRHNRVVTTVTWKVHKGDGCARRVKTSVRVVKCSGERLLRGKCNRKGTVTYSLYKRHTRNCGCIWKLVRRIAVPCRCRKAVSSQRCIKNHWVTLTKRWDLVGHKLKTWCKLSNSVQKRKVPCKVGQHVTKSHCDFRGLREFVTTTRTLHKCHCIEKVRRHTCRCRCHKPKTQRFCQNGLVWVTVRVTSALKNCACIGNSAISRHRVRCQRAHRIRGPCRRGRNGDKFRTLTDISWVVDHCKCRRIRRVRRILCGCDRRRRVHRWCLGGFFRIAKVTVRRLIYGRCRRVSIRRRVSRVRCGRKEVKRICHKKSGRLSIFVSRPYTKRCRCYRRVRRHNRRCGCHKGSKLVSIGKCNRDSCRQRLLFKKQVLRHEKCKWRKYHRHRVCCCRGRRRQVRCQKKQGLVITTIFRRVLKNWHCVRKVERRSRRVKCKRNLKIRTRKLSIGFMKVIRCWKMRRGCRCVRRCRTTFKRYRCRKPIKWTVCKCENGRCRRVTRVVSWHLSHGRCWRQNRTSRQPIVCKSNTSSRTSCNKRTKNGFFYIEKIVSWHQKSCRCWRRVRTRSVVCRCQKPHRHTSCQHGHIVKVNTSYRLNGGRCVKVSRRRSRVVRCRDTWHLAHRTSGSPHFFLVYERFVLKECKCVRQTKRVPCRSSCPRCTVKKRCESNANFVQVRTCHNLDGCRCIRNVKTTRLRVRCPKTSSKTHCHDCERTVITTHHHVHQCKCTTKTHVAKSKCCCPRPQLSKKCVRGSIRLREIRHTLRNSQCFSQTKDKFRPVNCSRQVHRAIEGKCKRGKQKYSVHYWVKLGCRCVRRVRHESHSCACANKAIELYLLLDVNKGCKNEYKKGILSFVHSVSVLFEDRHTKLREILVVGRHIKKVKDVRKILLGSSHNLLSGLHALQSYLPKHTHTGVQKSVLIITCGKHGNEHKSIEVAEKLQHLPDVSLIVVAIGPSKKEVTHLRMLSSQPHSHNFMHFNNLSKIPFYATQLFERICKRSCAKPVVHRSVCHKSNCRQVFTRTTSHFDQRKKKCVRRSSTWWKLCCCLERNTSHKECDRNRLFRVDITFSFKNHSCHRKVHRRDESAPIFASCKPRVSHKKGECRSNGWRKDTKIIRQVINCRCREHISRHLVRCRCNKPHEYTTCQRDNHIRHCRKTFTLTPKACIEHENCRAKRVTCKPSRTVRGKCDRFSCMRLMGSVWFAVENCKCKRYYKHWNEICCCKRQYQKVPHCDKRRNEKVEIETWLEFYNKGCRRRLRKISRPTHCPSRRVEHTKCVAMRDGFYRKRLEHDWYKRDCGCKERTRWQLELCSCRRGHRTKQCQSGSWVTTLHWLEKSGNRCVPRKKVVSRLRVTCSSKRHNRTGHCTHVKGDRRYAKVVQTWQRRVGCACWTARKVFFKLCGCPKPFHRSTCHGDSRRVTTKYSYRLHGEHCKLIKSSKSNHVHCPGVHTKLSKCLGKKQTVFITLHSPKHCQCVPRVHKRQVKCKAQCKDFLPTKVCRKWASSRHLCDKHPKLAQRLCALTCSRCYDCKKTKISYAGRHCLSKQSNFNHKFLIGRASSFDKCVHSCQRNPKCRAFDYEHSSGKCRLLSVNIDILELIHPKREMHKTSGCILFQRNCPKECNFRRILAAKKCRCARFGKQRLCYRTASVSTWKKDFAGKCRKHVQRLQVPCRRCEDKGAWCEKSKPKCSLRLVRRFCNYTCGVCRRKPRRFHHHGRCSRSGWLTETWGRVFFNKHLHLWQVSIRTDRRRCARCPVGSYQIIGQCKKGRRKITKVIARFTRHKCHMTVRTKRRSCKGCSLTSKKLVGKCKRHGRNWTRLVVTQYTVRSAGRCVVRQSIAVFSCSPKCPPTRVSHSKCKCGKRIQCIHYSVMYPGFNVCVPKKHTSIEKCESAIKPCHDTFRPLDCLFIKKNRMCEEVPSWCRKTCGNCNKFD